MATYRLTRPAEQDVLGIWLHVARDNMPAADRLVDRFTEESKREKKGTGVFLNPFPYTDDPTSHTPH